jgi:topoisomerase-4 subunit A
VLIKTFKLTEIQADSILNMRLRNLRKLEEMEIKTEDKNLRGELKGIKGLLGSETEQWAKVGEQVRKVRDLFGPKTLLGKRRTTFADAPEHDLAAIEEAFVEREPVTVVVSEKGWVRTMKGHMADLSGLQFKTDDKLDQACSPPTANSIRSMWRSCRAAAATASRSACSSTWTRTRRSSRCSSTRAAASS